MIYQRSHRFVRLFAPLVAVAVASASLAGKERKAVAPLASPPQPLIEVTGDILGVKLFGSIEDARERLAHLKIEKDATPAVAEKRKQGGSRIVWRLAETEYLWIVAWADKEGKIERISASVRPEKKKPFKEVGDLSRAKVHNESMAMWIVERPDGAYYRLVAKGPGEEAVTIYMYSLKSGETD